MPVTVDNLVTGWADAVKFGPFEQGDLLDGTFLDQVFEKYQPVAVMHFAALSLVGESMELPGKYWRNNVKDLCITSGFPRVGRFGKLAGKSLG